MSEIKPITLWGKQGPNPVKVVMVLEELGIPYKTEAIPLSDVKKPEYVAINPNGRVPAIQDPNTNLTLWESGAIIEYLVERYDKANKLGFAAGTTDSYLAKQWLYYQATGQGPYYGQGVWFKKYHHEQLPSAIERYAKEVKRVSGVLEAHLKTQKTGGAGDGPWLVGNKCSYADLAFIPWQSGASKMFTPEEFNADEFPLVKQWLENMLARPAVQKATNAGAH